MSTARRHWWVSLSTHAVLLVWVFLALFPIYFLFQASLRPGQQLYTTQLRLLPSSFDFENYRYMLFESNFPYWVRNSVLTAASTSLASLLAATPAAYAFSRLRFRGRSQILLALLALQSFPAVLSLIAIYLILKQIGLLGTLPGLVLSYASGTLVFLIWLMKGYFDAMPYELEEAAAIDGAGPFSTFRLVILPLATPVMAVAALMGFLAGWNEFVIASITLFDEKLYTVPVGMWTLADNYRVPWGWFAAASIMVTPPVLLLQLWLQRYLQAGLTLGSVKG